MASTEDLDRQIRILVAQLADAAPPAPPLPSEGALRRRRRRKRLSLALVPLVLAVLAGAAGATVPALLQTSPGVIRLFIRSTTTGVQVRVYEVTTRGGALAPYVEAELSTANAIGLLVVDASTEVPPRGMEAPQATSFGNGSAQAGAVAVRTGTDVTMVRAQFASGVTDTMRPVHGWAVLAEKGAGVGGQVLGFDASGRRVAVVRVPKPVESGEGFPGEAKASFVRVTNQGVLVIGHTVEAVPGGNRWLYPYLADGAAVQLGLEGIQACRPAQPRALIAGIVIVGTAEGEPTTVVVVHSGSEIARVRVEFSGGISDEMAVVEGQAVLVTLGTIAKSGEIDTLHRANLEGFSSSGKLLTKVPLYPNSTPYEGCTSD
jgi:hypothetical protein